MTQLDRIAATRRIEAPAGRIFQLVTDPAGHVAVDGSGMLVAPRDAAPVTGVGDAFLMDMDREPLGDLPMGKYQVEVRITRYEQDRQLEWSVGGPGRTPIGHVYGYLLEPVADTETDVTSYCDWSGVQPRWRERARWPVVPLDMLEASLDKLAALVQR